MKRFLAILITFVIAVSLCACDVESVSEHDSKVSSSVAADEKNGEKAQRETDEATDDNGAESTGKAEKKSRNSTDSAGNSSASAENEKSKDGANAKSDGSVNSNGNQKPLVTTAPANGSHSVYSYYVTEYEKIYTQRYISKSAGSEKKPGTSMSKAASSAPKTQVLVSGNGTKPGSSKSAAKARISVSQKQINVSSILTNPSLKESVKNSLPQDGVLIPAYSKITLTEGSTVFDALELAMKTERETYKNSKAVFEYKSSGYGSYVYSIAGLSERDCGAQSGWTYKVNGQSPGVSCDKYVLKAGDVVEWIYVTHV